MPGQATIYLACGDAFPSANEAVRIRLTAQLKQGVDCGPASPPRMPDHSARHRSAGPLSGLPARSVHHAGHTRTPLIQPALCCGNRSRYNASVPASPGFRVLAQKTLLLIAPGLKLVRRQRIHKTRRYEVECAIQLPVRQMTLLDTHATRMREKGFRARKRGLVQVCLVIVHTVTPRACHSTNSSIGSTNRKHG